MILFNIFAAIIVTAADGTTAPPDKKLGEGTCVHEKVEKDQPRARGQVQRERDEPCGAMIPVHRTEARIPPHIPHKIFVWDSDDAYRDVCFPYPRQGHFLTNHHTLKGAHILIQEASGGGRGSI